MTERPLGVSADPGRRVLHDQLLLQQLLERCLAVLVQQCAQTLGPEDLAEHRRRPQHLTLFFWQRVEAVLDERL